jgi:hypothetical protein
MMSPETYLATLDNNAPKLTQPKVTSLLMNICRA